jgi:hypothetical protein
VICLPNCERNDRERRVLGCAADKLAAIRDEQVADVVRLSVLVAGMHMSNRQPARSRIEVRGSSVALPPILRMSRRKIAGRRRSGTPIPPELFDLLVNYRRFRVIALQQISHACGRPLRSSLIIRFALLWTGCPHVFPESTPGRGSRDVDLIAIRDAVAVASAIVGCERVMVKHSLARSPGTRPRRPARVVRKDLTGTYSH